MHLPLFAIIDCAIKAPSLGCFNRLVSEIPHQMEYHWPSHYGLESLHLSRAQAFIVLGSFSNVEDRLDWQKELAVFLDAQLQQNKPVLGICFAHQLMADFYGAQVVKAASSHSGTREIQLHTPSAKSTFQSQYEWIVQHSFEVVQLPACLKCLASSPVCQNEVIAHQSLPFIGVQAHPEASKQFVLANFDSNQPAPNAQAFDDGLHFIKTMIHQMSERILHNPQKPLLS